MVVAELERERQLADELSQYAGRWVATCDFAVVASADTLEDLLEQITEEATEVDGVFHVPVHSTAASFF